MVYYLIGFKSCGKSTIGKQCAERTSSAFIDLDHQIEIWYEKNHGGHLSFREIYQQQGPEKFHQIEQQVLAEIKTQGPTIISVGGATVMDEKNRLVIKQTGKVIYIIVDPESLYERIMANGTPAFFDPDYPQKSFDRLFKKRTPVYESLADVSVDITGLDIEKSIQKVHDAIQNLNK